MNRYTPISNLFAFLSRFERCGELKKDWIKDERVYALGTYFSNNDQPSDRGHFLDKLTKLEKTLNFWPQREISVYGSIDIITTLALSKVIFACSFMEIPPRFAEE